jgi:hypothetical protein
LSNIIDLEQRRNGTNTIYSLIGAEDGDFDDSEDGVFVMDDVAMALRSASAQSKKREITPRKDKNPYEVVNGISIPRRKKRGTRIEEIELEMDDDRVLDELVASEKGVKRGWQGKKAT